VFIEETVVVIPLPNSCGNHYILFTIIFTILGQSNISHVFIEGTVVTKQKAIDTFKYSETSPVMMLSLENAASGTNLIQATHVILLGILYFILIIRHCS
jgi:hypothetical protein